MVWPARSYQPPLLCSNIASFFLLFISHKNQNPARIGVCVVFHKSACYFFTYFRLFFLSDSYFGNTFFSTHFCVQRVCVRERGVFLFCFVSLGELLLFLYLPSRYCYDFRWELALCVSVWRCVCLVCFHLLLAVRLWHHCLVLLIRFWFILRSLHKHCFCFAKLFQYFRGWLVTCLCVILCVRAIREERELVFFCF